ncbi:MAG: tetratricopeptide repeat protein, partial [Thermoanaerobaculia bacterium]
MNSRAAILLLAALGAIGSIGSISCSKPRAIPSTAAPAAISQSELRPILAPDLSQAEPSVREQLEAEYDSLHDLLAGDTGSAQLAEGFGELGLLYVAYTFNGAAEDCFQNAQSLAPQDYKWHYLSGYLQQIQGRLDVGIQSLEDALTLRPNDQPSLLRLGAARLEQGDYNGARRYYDRALAGDPRSAAALDGLGKVMAGSNDDAAAVDFFERALALQPTASSIHHALGLAYRNLGRRELAQDHLAKGGNAPVLFSDPLLQETTGLGRSAEIYLVRAAQAFSEERFEAAAGYYQEALELDPLEFTTYKAFGFSLEKIGDLDGAIEQLSLSLHQATTGDESRDRLERSEVYRILGGLTVLRGRQKEAIEHFRQAVQLNAENLDARSKLANALARQGAFSEAIGHYDAILEALPDHAETLVRRATAKINLGQGGPALEDFDRATQLEPANAKIRSRYAAALEFLGRSRQAQAQLQ